MRRQTPFTLEEAKAYIIKSIQDWETVNEPEKIISLAGMAYNRNTKSNIASNKAKLKVAQTNLNQIEAIIRRMDDADTSTLDTQREIFAKEVAELEVLVVKEAPITPKIRKTKSRLPRLPSQFK